MTTLFKEVNYNLAGLFQQIELGCILCCKSLGSWNP
jgi:hypothetical protein